MLHILLYGQSKELKFIFAKVHLDDISLSVINSIEDRLVGLHFELKSTCPEVKYYMLTKILGFN